MAIPAVSTNRNTSVVYFILIIILTLTITKAPFEYKKKYDIVC